MAAWRAPAMSVNSNPEAKLFDFIDIYSKERNSQVDPAVMLDYKRLILSWFRLGTQGRFKPTELEKALIGIWKPAWNKTRLSTELLVSAIIKKLPVMLAHSRYIPSRRELLKKQLPLERHTEFQEPG